MADQGCLCVPFGRRAEMMISGWKCRAEMCLSHCFFGLVRLLRHRVEGERMHGGGDDVRDDDELGFL